MMADKNDLLTRINNLRTEYSNENKKGLFSTKQYKFDCANTVLKTFNLDTLLSSMLMILPNSYHLFFDYTVFKTFATPELCNTIIQYAVSKIGDCYKKYGTYEMHVNLHSFSVSAFQRYKPMIEAYSNELNLNYPEFHENVKAMHVYNVPISIETISQLMSPFFTSSVKDRVILYDKESSKKPFQTIMEILQISNEQILEKTT